MFLFTVSVLQNVWQEAILFSLFRGYSIVAIMRPCQGRDRGSIPLTRFQKSPIYFGLFCDVLWWSGIHK